MKDSVENVGGFEVNGGKGRPTRQLSVPQTRRHQVLCSAAIGRWRKAQREGKQESGDEEAHKHSASEMTETNGKGVFLVPHRRNPNFTGREDILSTLRTQLTSGSTMALTQSIRGLGAAVSLDESV